ncbi:MAG: hypothetical protein BWK79_00125 [Beggiatoa sp. IS2]|nr:MAG: hypothetical protein BWK78_00015 [Thiotrichaceae bacterium IS1]OQW96060.1 MAG: hypothetical protein BWK79_00125 [Beggiatoa sp. IS2]
MNLLRLVNGLIAEFSPIVQSAGTADANKPVQTDAAGRLDSSLMPSGITPQAKIIPCSEALNTGDYVNIYWSATDSALRCRKADASTAGKYAHGFVKAGYASGEDATILLEGINDQVSGFTSVGGYVWLSATTPGVATTTPPSGSGQVVQILGQICASTEIDNEIQQPILLAS